MQKCDFRPSNWLPFPKVKVALTPSNVPTKLRLNNENRFGEKCKNVIQTLQLAAYKVNISPIGMSLPSLVGVTRIDWKKGVKV